jgi:hypothetical protein
MWPLLSLFALVLLSHGYLAFSDGLIVDDWWINEWLDSGDWDKIKYLTVTNGLYFQRYFYGLLMLFPDPNQAGNYLTIAALGALSVCTFILFLKTRYFSRREAFIIAALVSTVPAVKVYGNLMPMFFYVSCYLIFILCCLCLLIAKNQSWTTFILLRCFAVIGFFISFSTGSLLVFFFGFMFGLALLDAYSTPRLTMNAGARWITRHLDLIALPFLFWIWRRTFFPGVDSNVGYQQPTLSFLDDLPSLLYHLMIYEVPTVLFGPISTVFSFPIMGIVIFILAALGALLVTRHNLRERDWPRGSNQIWPLIFYGAVILFLSIFPYWATGRLPEPDGFNSRLAILMPLPLAIFFIALVRKLAKATALRSPSYAIWFIFFFFQLCFAVENAKAYLNWQLVGIKDKAVIVDLSKSDQWKNFSIIKVYDEFVIHPFYEQAWNRWPYIIATSAGDYKRHAYGSRFDGGLFIFPSDQDLIKTIKVDQSNPPWRDSALQDQIIAGPRGAFTVLPGTFFNRFSEVAPRIDSALSGQFQLSKKQKVQLIATYLRLKWTNSDEILTFLDSIVEVYVHPS